MLCWHELVTFRLLLLSNESYSQCLVAVVLWLVVVDWGSLDLFVMVLDPNIYNLRSHYIIDEGYKLVCLLAMEGVK